MDQVTDYQSLQDAVAGTLHRSDDADITANVPLWIQMAEADLNDRLLLRNMEQEDTLASVADQNYVALPSGYVSPIALWLVVDSERIELSPALPQELPYYSTSGQPRRWSIDGANIRFDCPADAVYSVPFRYLKSSSLSATNTTNALLLKRPDLYLYAAMWQACLFTEDDNGALKWFGLYEKAIEHLKNAENRSRSFVPLRSDIYAGCRPNILRGD